METRNVREFLDYYERVRQRTLKVIACIPPEKYDWSYREGKFSLADIIRHLGAIERYMYGENVQQKPSRYPGHGKELADGPENVREFFKRVHAESMEIFGLSLQSQRKIAERTTQTENNLREISDKLNALISVVDGMIRGKQ